MSGFSTAQRRGRIEARSWRIRRNVNTLFSTAQRRGRIEAEESAGEAAGPSPSSSTAQRRGRIEAPTSATRSSTGSASSPRLNAVAELKRRRERVEFVDFEVLHGSTPWPN